MKNNIVAGALLLASLSSAVAQTTEQGATITTEVAATVKVDASTPAVEGSIESLLTNVTDAAGGLEQTVTDLKERIAASANSAEEGTKLIDDMLAAATKVNASLGRDSDVWTQLNALMDNWTAKRDSLNEKGKNNPALLPVAETWQVKIDEAQILREQILVQAAESENLVQLLSQQREVILAYYDADAADAVLSTMQKMSEQLEGMNTEMKSILQQTGVVAEGKAVANE